MSLQKYDFDGFTINLYLDEQGDWLAYFLSRKRPRNSDFTEIQKILFNIINHSIAVSEICHQS